MLYIFNLGYHINPFFSLIVFVILPCTILVLATHLEQKTFHKCYISNHFRKPLSFTLFYIQWQSSPISEILGLLSDFNSLVIIFDLIIYVKGHCKWRICPILRSTIYLEVHVSLNHSIFLPMTPSSFLMQNSLNFVPWIRNIFLTEIRNPLSTVCQYSCPKL